MDHPKTFVLSKEQNFKVNGTSSIHKWELESTKGIGNAQFVLEQEEIKALNSFSITLQINSLSSNNKMMDKKVYETLRMKEDPNIYFDMEEMISSSDKTISIHGKIKIAGAIQIIPIEIHYSISENTINLNGSIDLCFSQFNIDPPRAMFGTIKTGDEFSISYTINFISD